MADFNKPAGSTSLWSTILTEIRSARESVAKMFDGGAGDTNIPTNAKRIDNATGEVLNYNGATWDSLGYVVSSAPTGTPVGTTDTQTLTNKTIDGASNTLTNIPLSAIPTVDEDNMASNSDVLVPTQQSVKAYVDAEVAGQVQVIRSTYSQTSIGYSYHISNFGGSNLLSKFDSVLAIYKSGTPASNACVILTAYVQNNRWFFSGSLVGQGETSTPFSSSLPISGSLETFAIATYAMATFNIIVDAGGQLYYNVINLTSPYDGVAEWTNTKV